MPIPSYKPEDRILESDTKLSALAKALSETSGLADSFKILNEMRAEAVELWNIRGSKKYIADAMANHVLPAMEVTMKKFGVAMREQNNLVRNGATDADKERLLRDAIAQENQYWLKKICDVPARNREEPTFHHDMMGVEALLRSAVKSAALGEDDLALKQLKDTTALLTRVVDREKPVRKSSYVSAVISDAAGTRAVS